MKAPLKRLWLYPFLIYIYISSFWNLYEPLSERDTLKTPHGWVAVSSIWSKLSCIGWASIERVSPPGKTNRHRWSPGGILRGTVLRRATVIYDICWSDIWYRRYRSSTSRPVENLTFYSFILLMTGVCGCSGADARIWQGQHLCGLCRLSCDLLQHSSSSDMKTKFKPFFKTHPSAFSVL